MNRRVRRGIVIVLGLAVVAVVLQAIFFPPSGPSVEDARTVQCEVNRRRWVNEISGVLAAASPDWPRMLQSIVDDDSIENPRCRFCLHAYIFNPNPAAWAQDADPSTIVIVCPGPHHGRPDNLMCATTKGTALEIPRDRPPAWFEQGVTAPGVEGKE